MRKTILLLSLMMFSVAGLYAKDKEDKKDKKEKLETEATKEVEGVVVYKNGKTKPITFQFTVGAFDNQLDVEAIQKEAVYLDSAKVKQSIRPEDVSEIKFTYDSVEYRMLSCPNKLKLGKTGKFIFLKLEQDGGLRLLRYYESSLTPTPSGNPIKTVTKKYVLRKSTDQMLMPDTENFKKDMNEFFADCQSLVFKITKNEYVKKDMQKIVRFYNAECK
jgi:hypothetical protein